MGKIKKNSSYKCIEIETLHRSHERCGRWRFARVTLAWISLCALRAALGFHLNCNTRAPWERSWYKQRASSDTLLLLFLSHLGKVNCPPRQLLLIPRLQTLFRCQLQLQLRANIIMHWIIYLFSRSRCKKTECRFCFQSTFDRSPSIKEGATLFYWRPTDSDC